MPQFKKQSAFCPGRRASFEGDETFRQPRSNPVIEPISRIDENQSNRLLLVRPSAGRSNDQLNGGVGTNMLSSDQGKDIFVYKALEVSTLSDMDTISTF